MACDRTAASLIKSRNSLLNFNTANNSIVKSSTMENFMTLNKNQVEAFRKKGIHMTENKVCQDLTCTFSDFNKAKVAINNKKEVMSQLNNTPLMG